MVDSEPGHMRCRTRTIRSFKERKLSAGSMRALSRASLSDWGSELMRLYAYHDEHFADLADRFTRSLQDPF